MLYLLLPESAELDYLPFLAVYLASVLVGVLSHVPAGLGVLESMLLLLLPDVPPEQLLAVGADVPRDLRDHSRCCSRSRCGARSSCSRDDGARCA